MLPVAGCWPRNKQPCYNHSLPVSPPNLRTNTNRPANHARPRRLAHPRRTMALLSAYTSWGTHGTSGVAEVDYYLSSPWIESPDQSVDCREHYTEKLVLLSTFPTFQQRQERRKTIPRSQFGLPDKVAIYFCPHRLPKYHPNFDSYIKGVLAADSVGHMAILTGRNYGSDNLRARLAQSLSALELKRIHFFSAMKPDRYLALINVATVVLDSPAYAGGISAYDAFSFGIPLITQPGRLAVQNYSSGLLLRMNIPELIANDEPHYVNLSVQVGTNPELRELLRRKILSASDLIFADHEAIRAHEAFFTSVVGLTDTDRCHVKQERSIVKAT